MFTAQGVSTILSLLTCESRQQAIENALGYRCQLIVIADAFSQAREHTRFQRPRSSAGSGVVRAIGSAQGVDRAQVPWIDHEWN
ncbi:hypothetical protein JET64_08150 [Pseudomonas putida]|nr:hypothetical protein [Pseudomonas putida]